MIVCRTSPFCGNLIRRLPLGFWSWTQLGLGDICPHTSGDLNVVFKPVFVYVFMLSWLQQLFAVLFIDLMLMTDWLHVSDMTLCSCLVCRWFHQLPSLLVWRCWLQTPPKSDGSVVSSCLYLVITLNFLTKSNITVQNGLEKLDSRLLAMTSNEDKIACESVRKLCGMLEEEVSVRGQWTLIMFSSNYLLF